VVVGIAVGWDRKGAGVGNGAGTQAGSDRLLLSYRRGRVELQASARVMDHRLLGFL